MLPWSSLAFHDLRLEFLPFFGALIFSVLLLTVFSGLVIITLAPTPSSTFEFYLALRAEREVSVLELDKCESYARC